MHVLNTAGNLNIFESCSDVHGAIVDRLQA